MATACTAVASGTAVGRQWQVGRQWDKAAMGGECECVIESAVGRQCDQIGGVENTAVGQCDRDGSGSVRAMGGKCRKGAESGKRQWQWG